jgi:ribosomal-protein-alanine N-acetyltransferase
MELITMTIFETDRLIIRTLTESDADFIYQLWTNPKVMKNVGFPHGLNITKDEIIDRYINRGAKSGLESLLVATKKDTGEVIGECYMGLPDDTGVCETDVKLSPEFWGDNYGIEIKRGLVDYIFTHTDAVGVKATPNVENIASQKMQISVGAKKVGGIEVYEFPESMRKFTIPVKHYTYIVYRNGWEKEKEKA